jgi:hypothetical protein
MRSARAVAACIVVASALSGCSSLDAVYIREGIGTTLSTTDLPEASYLQAVYVGEICRQADLPCEVGMRPSDWGTFVQAGMNDIDRRCDAYLAWLDNKRRWREPILKQIATTGAATAAIMGLTGVGPTAIAIVGTAFGFAADTFVNFSSRLITEVDHSVVQSVVLGNQHEFRTTNLNVVVDNKPAAIYLLRNYLRICMPFSIEMSINNTVTVFQRGGPEALRTQQLITRSAVATSTTSAGVRGAPLTARETIVRPVRLSPSLPEYRSIIRDYDATVHTISRIEPILIKLCVPSGELRAVGARAKALVQVYQDAVNDPVTGLLTTREIARLNNAADCLGDRRNYFEANLMPRGLNTPEVIDLVNTALPANRKLPPNATVQEVRNRIPEARTSLGSKLQLQSPFLSDQFTSDLMKELTRMKLFN